jgi:hypothetical protein
MKTMETTEEVSSDDPVKRVKRLKYQRSALVARGKRTADHKTGLQNCRTGRKSGKHPTLVVGQKPYGKSRLKQRQSFILKFKNIMKSPKIETNPVPSVPVQPSNDSSDWFFSYQRLENPHWEYDHEYCVIRLSKQAGIGGRILNIFRAALFFLYVVLVSCGLIRVRRPMCVK